MTPRRQIIRPGPGRCVIRPLEPDQQVDLGEGKTLWVPRPASHEGVIGEIVDPGERYIFDGTTWTPNYEKGAVVLIGKYTGMKIVLNRTESLILCKEQDIIGELVDEEEAKPKDTFDRCPNCGEILFSGYCSTCRLHYNPTGAP